MAAEALAACSTDASLPPTVMPVAGSTTRPATAGEATPMTGSAAMTTPLATVGQPATNPTSVPTPQIADEILQGVGERGATADGSSGKRVIVLEEHHYSRAGQV